MEFGILGPLEVLSDGKALDLGGAKQRTLLAVLLLHPNEVVPRNRLIDALWEEEPPETAQKALQVHVSQLRKALGKARLQTRAPGYLISVEDGELDLDRFELARAEGRLADALAMWRGPPLADFGQRRFAEPEIARLEALQLVCLEDRIEQDLQAGHHNALVGELESLVQVHPLRERLRGQLMLALYRSSRQAEALAAYQQARQTLVEELGIEPGRELRELHRAVLEQDPALDLSREHVKATGAPASSPTATGLPAPREARKTITALAVVVSAAAAGGGRLDPEAMRRAIGHALSEIEGAVERHGGGVETVSGDGAVSVFGLPTVHEDDALRAVRAAVEIRDGLAGLAIELSTQQWELDFRVGISTGEVVAGGETGPRVSGEPLTVSSRLAQAAESAEILVDEATRRLVRDAVTVEPTDAGWRLLRESGAASVTGVRRSPMVGRERERRRLVDAFEAAIGSRSCQLFTVLGPAGVGKSRLVREFLSGLAGQALVARGRCLPYGEGITFWPLLESVREAVGLDETDSAEEVQEKLARVLREDDEAEVLARRVAEVIGLAEVTTAPEERHAVVQTLFEALSRTRPILLVFDDIHWGEATFLDLVEHLADSMRDAPVLLLCLARPELLDGRPEWGGGKVNATTILLEPLSEEESTRLVDNLAGDEEIGASVRRRVVEVSEGNPLFVEEMLALALEDGGQAEELLVPPTIQALLAARLDRLGDEERAVIELAAVEGKVFHERAIAELAPESLRPTVSSALAGLCYKELIRPERRSLGGRAYRFRHLLIRDAAYESIPKEARAAMHERFGRWLDGVVGKRTTEFEEIVGYHLEQAYTYRAELGSVEDEDRALAQEAAEKLGSAGRRAFVRSDAPAGVNLISRAAALLPPESPLRVALIPNVRVVQGMGADTSWAERVLTEAIETAATTGDRGLAAHALVQRGFLRLFTDPAVKADELIDTAQRAIAVFTDLQDELGLARAWRLCAQSHYLDRRLGACVEASEHGLMHARSADDRFEEREIVEWLVIALFLGPTPADEAAARCRRLLDESADDELTAVQILGGLAYLTALQGHLEEAQELIARARCTMQEIGEWLWIHSWHVAFLWILVSDPASAEREIRPAYEALKQIGEKSHFSTMTHALALAVYEQGRYEEAGILAEECEEATQANDVNSRIVARTMRGRVLARKGRLEEAMTAAREAVELATGSDLYVAHGDALAGLAEVLELAGEPADAIPALEAAVRLYGLKGDVVSAGLARARLGELEAETAPG